MPLYDFKCPECSRVCEVDGVWDEIKEYPPLCGYCNETPMTRVYGFNAKWTNSPTNGGKAMDRRKKSA